MPPGIKEIRFEATGANSCDAYIVLRKSAIRSSSLRFAGAQAQAKAAENIIFILGEKEIFRITNK